MACDDVSESELPTLPSRALTTGKIGLVSPVDGAVRLAPCDEGLREAMNVGNVELARY